jgi:hypothetical protein
MEVRIKMTKTNIKLNTVLNSIHSNNSNLVEIVFDDPTEFDTTRNDITKPVECTTIGWIKSIDTSSIVLTWLKELKDSSYIGLAIPVGCIKKITPIKPKKVNSIVRRLKK